LTESNPHDTYEATRRWVMAKGQRQARETGKDGKIPIEVRKLDANGIICYHTAYYNTHTEAVELNF